MKNKQQFEGKRQPRNWLLTVAGWLFRIKIKFYQDGNSNQSSTRRIKILL